MSQQAQSNNQRDERQDKSPVYFSQEEKRRIQQEAQRAAANKHK